MPATFNKKNSAKVNTTYIKYKRLAVSVILGCNLSADGPGASAINNCMPPIPSSGKIAMVNTIIPIPPIQCVADLQKRIPFGIISISFKIDEPVVEYPEMVSKKASGILGIAPDNK